MLPPNRRFADKLSAANVVTILKRRVAANVIDSMQLVGDVNGFICLIVDDIIDTAGLSFSPSFPPSAAQEAKSKKQEARSKKQKARSKKQEAKSKKQEARSKKQEARSKKQEARSKKQEARSKRRWFGLDQTTS